MDKRKNKILVGCLALLLVMAVGYALFSENITINGTATAKGDFNIDVTCETGISSKFGSVSSLGLRTEGGYTNDSCSVIDNAVFVSANFLYPSAQRYFTIKFTNTGTIDATYDNDEYSINQKLCVADNIEGSNKICESGTSKNTFIVSGYSALWGFALLGMEDSNGNLLSQSEMSQYIDFNNNIYTLPPNYSAYLYYGFGMGSVTNATTGGEIYFEYNTTLSFPFKQVTAQ